MEGAPRPPVVPEPAPEPAGGRPRSATASVPEQPDGEAVWARFFSLIQGFDADSNGFIDAKEMKLFLGPRRAGTVNRP
jgi:hypothetical protein